MQIIFKDIEHFTKLSRGTIENKLVSTSLLKPSIKSHTMNNATYNL